MPTVIDSLIVELGLDPKKLTSGQRDAIAAIRKAGEAARKHGGEIEEAGKRAALFFNKLRNEALGLAALFLGGLGMEKVLTNFAQGTSQVGRFASTIGVGTEDLTEFGGAAKTVGGSLDETRSSMQSLTRQLQFFELYGESEVVPLFRSLGIGMKDANDRTKTAAQLFRDLNRAFQGMDPRRAEALATSLGMDRGTFDLLRLGTAEFEKRLKWARDNAATTKEETEHAARLQQAWANVALAAEKLARVIVNRLEPGITRILDKFAWLFGETSAAAAVPPESRRPPVPPTGDVWTKLRSGAAFQGGPLASLFPPAATPGPPPPEGPTPIPEGAQRRNFAVGWPEFFDRSRTGMYVGAPRAAAVRDFGRGGSTTTSEVNIGTVVVQTQATDAEGIARDLGPALRRHGLATQANYGQQ